MAQKVDPVRVPVTGLCFNPGATLLAVASADPVLRTFKLPVAKFRVKQGSGAASNWSLDGAAALVG